MSRIRIMTSSVALLLGLLAASGCDPEYGRVSLRQLRSTPDAELGPDGIVVPEGGVLVFTAQPRAAEGSPDYVGLERFELSPSDSRIAEARRSILRDTWVVNGVEAGSITLHVLIDGDVVDEIPLEVVVGTSAEPEEGP